MAHDLLSAFHAWPWKLPALLAATGGALAATVFAASFGVTTVVAHLFFVPVILAVCWYGWKGVAMAAALLVSYLLVIAFFFGPASSVFIEAAGRAVVIAAVSLLLALLSARIAGLAQDYHGIFEHSGGGILIIDREVPSVLAANRAAAGMLGFSPEDVEGRSFSSLFPDAAVGEDISAAIGEGRPLEAVEAALTARDGSVRWVRISTGSLPGGRVACTLLDVSDRREEVREMEVLARFTGDNPNPVFRVDSAGRMMYANAAAASLESIWDTDAGRPFRVLIAAVVARAMDGGKNEEIEVTIAGRTVMCTVVPAAGEGYANIYGRDITDMKRVEEAIRLEEQRLEALVRLNGMAAAPVRAITDYALEIGITLTDSEIGYFAFLNEDESVMTIRSLSQKARELCRVKDLPEVYPLEKTGLWGEPVRQRRTVIVNDYAAPSPLKRGTPPGHSEIRRFMSVPVFSGGRIVAVAGVANKVGPYDEADARQLSLLMSEMWALLQRKWYAEDLARSENLYRTVFETTGTATMVIDEAGTVTHVNSRFGPFFGYDPADLVGKSVWSTLFTGPAAEVTRRYHAQRRYGTGAPSTYEVQLQDRDGQTRDVLLTAALIPGTLTSIVSLADITTLKETERELLERNRELSFFSGIGDISVSSSSLPDMLGAMLQAVLQTSGLDGGAIHLIESGGATASLVCQYGVHDAAAVPAVSPVAEGALPAWAAEQFAAAVTVPLLAGQERLGVMTVGGDHPFSDKEESFLAVAGGAIGIAVQRAVLRAERERASEEANLYLDIMTHDINNANAVAMGYSSLLVSMLSGREEALAKGVLAGIRQSAEIITNVSTYRTMSRRQTRVEPIPLDRVIRGQVAVFSDVDVRYGGTDGIVAADELLSEVFANLIGNAVKFGGTGVTVWITVADRNGEVAVTVADNGPGIPDDQKVRVFERFVRNSTRVSGKGLGLWIVKMLVERYGGSIAASDRVAGNPGEGAAMVVVLRKAKAAGK
ncbi:MAG: PAS domain S-box protein [Methanofollis sp.]|uniref:PAS domain S-box protein n=1 Tax=Methanofollis sp. TaxID=2052835 RepID=UPI002610C58D|nr:PAS domain S-box protein [Methanofollis sp.]MDD4254661.1 PAS domain S-box protein [Methanofollis sp.]